MAGGRWSRAGWFERARLPVFLGTLFGMSCGVYFKYRHAFADEIRARQEQKEGHGINWFEVLGVNNKKLRETTDRFDERQKASFQRAQKERNQMFGEGFELDPKPEKKD